MSGWLNDLSDGQFSVLAVAVIALVFLPAFYVSGACCCGSDGGRCRSCSPSSPALLG
jgi:hypothetical protein